MASSQWFRSRQIVCVTAGCLMLVGQAWGQSNPPVLLGTAISPTAPQTATGQFVNRVFRDDEGEHHELKVSYPLTWRRRLPTTTLFYTLPIGREASVRDAPTPGVVLVRDEIALDDIADAPRSAHLEVSSPITQ